MEGIYDEMSHKNRIGVKVEIEIISRGSKHWKLNRAATTK